MTVRGEGAARCTRSLGSTVSDNNSVTAVRRRSSSAPSTASRPIRKGERSNANTSTRESLTVAPALAIRSASIASRNNGVSARAYPLKSSPVAPRSALPAEVELLPKEILQLLPVPVKIHKHDGGAARAAAMALNRPGRCRWTALPWAGKSRRRQGLQDVIASAAGLTDRREVPRACRVRGGKYSTWHSTTEGRSRAGPGVANGMSAGSAIHSAQAYD